MSYSRPHARKKGLPRIVSAFRNSCNGFVAVWEEPAFRQEVLLAAVLVPAACFVGRSWLEVCVLIGMVVFVLVTEILNSAVEAVVDRVGPEWHALSKSAKDMGSAAVLLALCLCGLTWAWALYERFLA
ncbi:diacylglycerol kinase [Lampropedia cohaerens]|uniref:Diacylglycerol kinase n=1 Tax=Lampropedia cohaerens TaxID=1610491 RepID=A0A0U1PY21_9BURK|nr:diacylglycerol kinase [Lampropedia cohaerens]KKW67419.1 diacylglycerol kinase [Lampropedia cohaerens]